MALEVGTERPNTVKKRARAEPAPIGEKLLTLREAAGILRMNPRTLRAYLRRREIEGRVIGGKYRFRRIDLDRFYEDAPRNWDFRGKDEQRITFETPPWNADCGAFGQYARLLNRLAKQVFSRGGRKLNPDARSDAGNLCFNVRYF